MFTDHKEISLDSLRAYAAEQFAATGAPFYLSDVLNAILAGEPSYASRAYVRRRLEALVDLAELDKERAGGRIRYRPAVKRRYLAQK